MNPSIRNQPTKVIFYTFDDTNVVLLMFSMCKNSERNNIFQ